MDGQAHINIRQAVFYYKYILLSFHKISYLQSTKAHPYAPARATAMENLMKHINIKFLANICAKANKIMKNRLTPMVNLRPILKI